MTRVSTSPDDQITPARTGAQSISRAIAVLQCFERAPELGVTEIAGQTGFSVATAHRIVRALCAGGLLDQNQATERYHLGFGTAVLGRLAMERLGFAFALPELQLLAAETGEAVNLGVRVGHEVLVLLSVPSTQPLRFDQGPGTRNPVHVCAMGKVLLALGPHESLTSLRLKRYTPNTLTTVAELSAELKRIQQRGYGINNEERNLGVRAIAAPIRDATGQAIAAVTLQAPTVRLTDERLDEVAALVLQTGERLTDVYQRRPDVPA